MPLLAYNFIKTNVCKKGHGCFAFSSVITIINYQGGTGEFIYKASIIGNKQLLSNTIDHVAT